METNVNSRRVKSSAEGESIQKQIEDLPIIKGEEAGNSAILKGETVVSGITYKNRAISQTSMAVGAATTAGLKGWYYSAIDFTNKTITLSDKPTYILAGSTLIGGSWSSGTPNIKVNDVISLVNNSKYDLCSKVTAVNGNVVTVDILPFTVLVRDNGAAAAVNARQFSDGYSLYIPERPDAGIIDFGGGAFSEGGQSKASNICAHAEGLQTHAYGQYSHAEGRENKAGYAAHAEGRQTSATGEQSHTEGRQTSASGNCSHAEGRNTSSLGVDSHAEGRSTTATGDQSHAEGEQTKAIGLRSHAEGYTTNASGRHSHAEGEGKTEGGAVSLLVGAHGRSSHTEGIATTTGEYDEQNETWSKGDAAHAEGNLTIASGNHSHAEGSGTKASGWQAHSEGHNTLAKGNRSHAEGSGTEALNLGEHAQGSFNKSTESNDKSKATQFSIGIGTSATDRKNAVEVKANGDIYIIGVGGFNGIDSDSALSLQEVIARYISN